MFNFIHNEIFSYIERKKTSFTIFRNQGKKQQQCKFWNHLAIFTFSQTKRRNKEWSWCKAKPASDVQVYVIVAINNAIKWIVAWSSSPLQAEWLQDLIFFSFNVLKITTSCQRCSIKCEWFSKTLCDIFSINLVQRFCFVMLKLKLYVFFSVHALNKSAQSRRTHTHTCKINSFFEHIE